MNALYIAATATSLGARNVSMNGPPVPSVEEQAVMAAMEISGVPTAAKNPFAEIVVMLSISPVRQKDCVFCDGCWKKGKCAGCKSQICPDCRGSNKCKGCGIEYCREHRSCKTPFINVTLVD